MTQPSEHADTQRHKRPRQQAPAFPRLALNTAWRAAGDTLGLALVAALVGIAAMLAARLLFGLATPAELLGDRLTALIPLHVFSGLLSFFGPAAKHIYFASVVVAQGIATALLMAGYAGLRGGLADGAFGQAPSSGVPADGEPDSTRRLVVLHAWDVPILAGVYWLTSAGLLAPLVGGGPVGSALPGGAGTVALAELVPAVTSAIVFVAFTRRAPMPARGAPGEVPSPDRRRVLRQAGFALAVLAAVALAWRFIEQGVASLGLASAGPRRPLLDLGTVPRRISPPPTPNYGMWATIPGQSAEITPTPRFYYVSKNLVNDPSLDPATWKVTIGGLVDRPASLSYSQLRALAAVERYQTLECISNEVGGNLMSNARWTGVRLANLLGQAGIRPGASELIFRCADGYSDSLHLAQVLNPEALLVYAINGEPLPEAHGAPARLLIPGLYGMKNGKWVVELEVGSGGYLGYWEQRGWTREARVKTTARIDVPADGDLLPARSTVIAGVAFAGDRGIARVDVSTDAGRTWAAAVLRRPLSSDTWVLWELPWRPPTGTHVLVARAIEASGVVQSPSEAPPLPSGASGYHAITVNVG